MAALRAELKVVSGNDVGVLNVAGPRASKWPQAFGVTKGLVTAALERMAEAR